MDTSMNERGRTRTVWRVMLWGGLGILLTMPALAMSLGAEGVDWSVSDFVIMGALFGMLGLAIEAAMRLLKDWRARTIACGAVLVVFAAVWVELAVGVLGTPFAGS